jgi:NO-binding membrane sensor protein with MHYT domain
MTDDRERTERQMAELLQELRIALPGVQILFAFLLTVPFAQGFERVTSFQRNLFFATLLVTAISTACFIAPTATHRLRFHQRDRKYVIDVAHKLTIAGLVFLAFAILLAVALITDYLFDGPARWIWPALIAVVIAVLWFIRPLLRTGSSGP